MILEANPVYPSQLSERYTQRCLFFSMDGMNQLLVFRQTYASNCGKDMGIVTTYLPVKYHNVIVTDLEGTLTSGSSWCGFFSHFY